MKQVFAIWIFTSIVGCAGIGAISEQLEELENPRYSLTEAPDRYVCELAVNPFTQEYGGPVIWSANNEAERKWVREASRRDLDCTVPGHITLPPEGRKFTMFKAEILGSTNIELCSLWTNSKDTFSSTSALEFFENEARNRKLDCRSDTPRITVGQNSQPRKSISKTPIKIGNTSEVTLSPVELFRVVNPSVYLVFKVGQERDALGSAVAVDDNSLVTNCHVIESAKKILLFDVANERFLGEPSRAEDLGDDRCVLRVRSNVTPIAGFRRFSDLEVGEKVYTVGSPSGQTNSLAEGLISGLREKDSLQMIQTTAQISQGSSGGGLFDSRGNLIGITTYILRDSQNLNFAISIDEFGVKAESVVPNTPVAKPEPQGWQKESVWEAIRYQRISKGQARELMGPPTRIDNSLAPIYVTWIYEGYVPGYGQLLGTVVFDSSGQKSHGNDPAFVKIR